MQIYSGLLLAYSTTGVNKCQCLTALPYNVKIEGLSQEVYYHNMSIIIT